jgi:PAS domain S-box-containing protein
MGLAAFLLGCTVIVVICARLLAAKQKILADEKSLRRNQEWLRVTLTSIGDAVIACDTQKKITFINPVAAQLTGWDADSADGMQITDIFKIINEQTRLPAEDIIAKVLRERSVLALANHTALVAKDGREIPIEDSAAPIIDDAGNITGVVLVFHDVTEMRRAREQLRQSEQRIRLKLESILSPEGDVGKLELADIIDASAIQVLMNNFYQLTHIPMAIIDNKGTVLVGVGWQDICTKFHRIHPETCKYCVESDTQLSAGVPVG